MMLRRYVLATAAALVAGGLYLAWLWQPERQVRLHTSHFLKKVERRNWESARKFLASDYADRWEHDADTAIADAREVFRQFLIVTIENRIDSCAVLSGSAQARTQIKISGNGGPLAQLVMDRVNTLREPFTFTWRKASGKPWDWQLTGVDHPELETERFRGF